MRLEPVRLGRATFQEKIKYFLGPRRAGPSLLRREVGVLRFDQWQRFFDAVDLVQRRPDASGWRNRVDETHTNSKPMIRAADDQATFNRLQDATPLAATPGLGSAGRRQALYTPGRITMVRISFLYLKSMYSTNAPVMAAGPPAPLVTTRHSRTLDEGSHSMLMAPCCPAVLCSFAQTDVVDDQPARLVAKHAIHARNRLHQTVTDAARAGNPRLHTTPAPSLEW